MCRPGACFGKVSVFTDSQEAIGVEGDDQRSEEMRNITLTVMNSEYPYY